MKLKYPIIAFTGPAGAGKTTAGKAVVAALNGEAVLFSFATPLRMMLRTLGVPVANLTDPALKEEPMPQFGGKSARQLMQSLGTEWGRNMVDPHLWTQAALYQILHLLQGDVPVVIDDLRFNNEAEMVHELGGIVAEVTPKGGVKRGEHASERGISSSLIDAYFTNDMTPAFLASVSRYCTTDTVDLVKQCGEERRR